MPVPKGQRFGGRGKGTPNKATTERERKAMQELVERAHKDPKLLRPLPKDRVDDLLPLIHDTMVACQHAAMKPDAKATAESQDGKPVFRGLPGMPGFDREQWALFKSWAEFYVEACARVADFYSPRFRAIAVAMPAAQIEQPTRPDNVVEINDPIARARVYQRLIISTRG
jgi:hypothetical protein